MGDKSAIHWTDATWNPVTGYTKVSQGCKNCYAKFQAWPRLAANPTTVYFGRKFEDVQCHPELLEKPLRWRNPRRVFVNSMSDLFHEDVPDDFVAAVFGIMAAAPQHTFQILTKRPERIHGFFEWLASALDTPGKPRLEAAWQALFMEKRHHPAGDSGPLHCKYGASPDGPWPLPNVWLGVSVEDQKTADERIPLLLETPATVRFVSYEPALEGVNLFTHLMHKDGIHWLIVGGESGPKARPCHVN